MSPKPLQLTGIFLVYLLLISCNVTKHLPEDALLLGDSGIRLESSQDIPREKRLKRDLYTQLKPEPNSGFFKFPLWLNLHVREPNRKKGFRHWLKNRVGEAPVLFAERDASINCIRMKKYLKDHGFFSADVNFDTISHRKKVDISYSVKIQGQHRLRNIYFPDDTTRVAALARYRPERSLLQSGNVYRGTDLENERSRLASLIGNNGYPGFGPDNIYFFVDSIPKSRQADIYIRIKEPGPGQKHWSFQLNNTYAYPTHSLGADNARESMDTILYNPGLSVVQKYHTISPAVLNRMILQEKGDLYSRRFQDISINHLLDLGIFKFVNLRFVQDTLTGMLDRHFYLTPAPVQTVTADLELNNRTGRFYGSAATVSYTHYNLLRRAYRFNVSVSAGIETQIGNKLAFINTTDLNVQLELSVPRFVVPFRIKKHSGTFVPRTNLSAGNDYQLRTNSYTINSTNFSWGYSWRETSEKQHLLKPVVIRRVRVSGTSEDFEALLNANKRLAQSFRNIFTGGLEYSYIYSTLAAGGTGNYRFFRGNFSLAGNLFRLSSQLLDGKKNTDGNYTLLDIPYSQFVSLHGDYRYYVRMHKGVLASRLATGIGVAYGNASVLPYSEQFYVGGANSIRAFRLRGLGPGAFVKDPDTVNDFDRQFLDQTGDLILEGNLEYRFPVFSYLKGALFVDAGNVWLLKDDEDTGGVFRFSDFWNEIAIGAGAGLRLDFQYFVIRLDAAVPLRRPYFGEGFRWTFDRLQFSNRESRRENLIFNLALGYPF